MDIEANGTRATRKSNVPLALGKDAFTAQAQGIVWDLRGLSEGVIVPLDFSAPLKTHLNLPLLRELLSEWPDQELVSFLVEGVDYKADIEHQIVLLPHLISLKEGYASLQQEVDKYANEGWYGLFSWPPFLPFRAVPKGSVPRKLEPDRPRPTTEAGAPRQPLWDTSGDPVLSLNEASSGVTPASVLPDGTREPDLIKPNVWPKENKPTVAHALVALVVLKVISSLIGSPVFAAADDFKNFFNQMKLRPSEYFKCGMMLSEGSSAKFTVEYVMTFGLRPASNIAQRWADSLLEIWRTKMDALEQAEIRDLQERFPPFNDWCKAQGGLIRLTAALIYTDDVLIMACGPERMALALRVWTELMHDLGILMAIPQKRQCGTWVQWLGAGISTSLALAWVPVDKVLSALSRLTATLEHSITVGDYHSLLGLLEHLVFLNQWRRSLMYYMWAPFKGNHTLEPNLRLVVTESIEKACHKWITLLSNGAAVSAKRMIDKSAPSAQAVVVTITSDAATDRVAEMGIGGWMHGKHFGQQLGPEYGVLPIAALEFVAAIVALLSFARHLPKLSPSQLIVHLSVDALATPFVLTDDAASSPCMVAIHEAVLLEEEFQHVSQYLIVSHIYGMANEFADAASRAHHSRLAQLAAQLRITPTEVSVHPVCQRLLAVAIRSLTPCEQSLEISQANTPDSASQFLPPVPLLQWRRAGVQSASFAAFQYYERSLFDQELGAEEISLMDGSWAVLGPPSEPDSDSDSLTYLSSDEAEEWLVAERLLQLSLTSPADGTDSTPLGLPIVSHWPPPLSPAVVASSRVILVPVFFRLRSPLEYWLVHQDMSSDFLFACPQVNPWPARCMCVGHSYTGFQCTSPRLSGSRFCAECAESGGDPRYCNCYCSSCFPFEEELGLSDAELRAACGWSSDEPVRIYNQSLSDLHAMATFPEAHNPHLSRVAQSLDITCANTMDSASQLFLPAECFTMEEQQALTFVGVWPSMCLEYQLIYCRSSIPLHLRLRVLYEDALGPDGHLVRRQGVADWHYIGLDQTLPVSALLLHWAETYEAHQALVSTRVLGDLL
jgi:hypothetical protein